jgi:hypothetical protein
MWFMHIYDCILYVFMHICFCVRLYIRYIYFPAFACSCMKEYVLVFVHFYALCLSVRYVPVLLFSL